MPGGGTFLVDECGDNRYEGVSSIQACPSQPPSLRIQVTEVGEGGFFRSTTVDLTDGGGGVLEVLGIHSSSWVSS